jgi:predicted nucleic acid-binding Zn ribbon protein
METAGQHIERHCLNCSASLPEDAVYCPQCGQKDKDTRVSFFKIAREAILALLNLDTALLRTLPNLLIPGKLTIEFFRGRQKRYMNPVRLFLWVTLILIALITLRTNEGDVFKINGDSFSRMKSSWEMKKALVPLDSAMEKTRQYFPQYDLDPVFDSIQAIYVRQLPSQQDSIDLHGALQFGVEDDSLKVSMNDLYGMHPDTLLAKYRVEGFWNRIVTKQKAKFLINGTSFGSFFIGKLTWAVILLMPLLALTMKLLYIRRDFYYVEHLIFSIHTHTMAFLMFILALVLEPWMDDFEQAFLWLLALTGIYVLIAQKRYYKQKWLKTILKFSILQVLYNVLIAIVLILTLIAGFFLF